MLPVTWARFRARRAGGSLLFISQATAYFANTTFRIKMLIIVLAGINMLVFELITMRGVQDWDPSRCRRWRRGSPAASR